MGVEAVLLLYIDLRALYDVFPHMDRIWMYMLGAHHGSVLCKNPLLRAKTLWRFSAVFMANWKIVRNRVTSNLLAICSRRMQASQSHIKGRMANACLQSSSMLGTIFNTIETSASSHHSHCPAVSTRTAVKSEWNPVCLMQSLSVFVAQTQLWAYSRCWETYKRCRNILSAGSLI